MNVDLLVMRNLLIKMADPTDKTKPLTHALGVSALTYFSNDFIEKNLSKLNFKFKIIERKEMKCIIAEDDTIVYIGFRGTQTTKILNWKRILNLWPKKFIYNIKVHGGFELYYQDYAELIKEELQNIDKNKKVIFTGHSLGAALASLFNMTYTENSHSIGFGTPNFIFNDKFTTDCEYYKITSDPITMLPFSVPPLFSWRKTNKSILLRSFEKHWFPLSYHRLENYIRSII